MSAEQPKKTIGSLREAGSVASFAVNGRWFLLLTFVRKRSKLITDICQKGDAYAKTDTMPENRKNACLPQLLTG